MNVKEFGESIDRICSEFETKGCVIPSFHVDAFILKATLMAEWTSEDEFDRPSTVQEELGTTQKTTQKLSVVQQKIVNCIVAQPTVSRKELSI